MRALFFIFLFFLTAILHLTSLIGQGVAINNIIATDIKAASDDVLEINFEDHLPNVPFLLAWVDSTGKQFALSFITSKENLVIPLGAQQGWEGHIGLVGLSINHVETTFRKSGMREIWSTFLTNYPMSPGSVNFTGTYYFLGRPFYIICAVVMVIITIIVFGFKKRWDIALLIGFSVAWGLYDIRSGYNRWSVLDQLSESEWHIPLVQDLESFLSKAEEVIGPDGSWTKERLSGFLNSYCTYELAHLTYYPRKDGHHKNAEYTITTQPKKRDVVLNEGIYYLIKNK